MSWDPRHTPPDVAVLVESPGGFEHLLQEVTLRPVSNEGFGGNDYAFEYATETGRAYRCIATFVGGAGTVQAVARLWDWKPACLVYLGSEGDGDYGPPSGIAVVWPPADSDVRHVRLARAVEEFRFNHREHSFEWSNQGWPLYTWSIADAFGEHSDEEFLFEALYAEDTPVLTLFGFGSVSSAVGVLLALLSVSDLPRAQSTSAGASSLDTRVSDARLTGLTLNRFKSYEAPTDVVLSPLTIIVGRNNGGKSTIIQALLLLRQTLLHRRQDVPLHLDGPVDALSLRELTWGWPEEAPRVEGPVLTVRWRSVVDIREMLAFGNSPAVAEDAPLVWPQASAREQSLETQLRLVTAEVGGRAIVERVVLTSFGPNDAAYQMTVTLDESGWHCDWGGQNAQTFRVEFDHFLPYLRPEHRQRPDSQPRERAWHAAYFVLFEQPLDALRRILVGMQYLGSTRTLPPSVYKAGGAPPDDFGASGEYAAELMHVHQTDVIHYVAPLRATNECVEVDSRVHARPFVSAVNDVFAHLGVSGSLSVQDVPNIGFRLLFGNANLNHVGRGLTYLLPIIELGLFADPLRFRGEFGDMTLEQYKQACSGYTHIAFEEPESHLHPKVQTRLAHWMVALAMANRQLIVETHSDHLVRRLRGLMARAESGSELETWLRENVSIIEVEQQDGRSSIRSSRLTPDGSMADHWPADFMDEASEEESRIYYAALDKPSPAPEPEMELSVEHDVGDEPEPVEEP